MMPARLEAIAIALNTPQVEILDSAIPSSLVISEIFLARQLERHLADRLAQGIDQNVAFTPRPDERRRHDVEMAERAHQQALGLAALRDPSRDIRGLGQRLARRPVPDVLP